MSRRFNRLCVLLVLFLAGNVWAIGLGDINLDSALNEPLRAEISLLSASPDELTDLTVALASAETFARYGIDRPFFLQDVQFNVVGSAGGSVVQIRSRAPITEPFLTFLVEATWASGRLLREYTVLLDPPTYVAPSVQQSAPVAAPRRSTPRDSGRIERQSAPTQAQEPARPAPQPSRAASGNASDEGQAARQSTPLVDNSPYDTSGSRDVTVDRGQTLWGVAARNRPDNRLSMNQTMLAIYEANRDSFGGNINLLKAGARLRIPSADEIFRISRNDASSEVKRQHSAWDGDGSESSSDYEAPVSEPVVEPTTKPSLTLVPPDEDPVVVDYDDTSTSYEPPTRDQEISDRIDQLEAADVPNQQSLIEIRDNELAALRQELADIRGEVYAPPVDDISVDELAIDDVLSDDTVATEDADAVAPIADDVTPPVPTNIITSSRDEGLVDKIIGFLTGFWGIVIGALALVVVCLVWFMRRGGDDEETLDRPWETLDAEEMAAEPISATAAMQAPVAADDAFVVVEQESGVHPILEDTVESPATTEDDGSGAFGSLEDTFSSETAVNLDQTDPIAEADFHMAYGLYDQAADLINGALESDPTDRSLMSKLCEVYFVWGNRDAFVEAATRLKAVVGDGGSGEWDKIVIMGQQIASDDHLFAGAELAGGAQAVDMSFDDAAADDNALDMDFGTEDESDSSEVIDLGEESQGVDFNFDDTSEQPAMDLDFSAGDDTSSTAEMPVATQEAPTVDEPFAGFGDNTSELPSLDEASLNKAMDESLADSGDATAEINLDDLDLDIGDFAATELASLDDLDSTGQNEALGDLDISDVTGKNPELDPDATGTIERLDLGELEESGMRLAVDETGHQPRLTEEADHDLMDIGIDESLLDATGRTQILSDTMAVETAADLTSDLSDADATQLAPGLGSDAETMLASLDDDDDFDFAKTEALPPEAFSGDADAEETAETPALAGTDVDLDLDDLTAALKVSEIGDTIEQPRDDATVEQPRPLVSEDTAEIPTMSLSPDDLDGDLHEARTMTEVGTKLDLARAYVDMGDPSGARSILEEVLDEGDDGQKQQAQQLLDSLPS